LIAASLEHLIPLLLSGFSNRRFVLIGSGSAQFRDRILERHPDLTAQIEATGEVDSVDLSAWLTKCDLMIQPYPDGISSRRGSAMAALAHGLAMVASAGPLTEGIWAHSGAAALVPVGDPNRFIEVVNNLIADQQARTAIGTRARHLYSTRFDVRHTVEA